MGKTMVMQWSRSRGGERGKGWRDRGSSVAAHRKLPRLFTTAAPAVDNLAAVFSADKHHMIFIVDYITEPPGIIHHNIHRFGLFAALVKIDGKIRKKAAGCIKNLNKTVA